MQETSYCACFFSVKIHERVFSSTLWALMQERSLTQIPTATSTWTSYFVTADAKCITFLDFQKFEFCKEIQTQLTVSFVRHYINLCNSIKSCSITGLTPSQTIYLDQNCCPTAFCKKLFPFSERMLWSCFMRWKSILFIRGIALPNLVKMAGTTAGMHRIKLHSESAVNSNHLFLPPSIKRITLVCLWD